VDSLSLANVLVNPALVVKASIQGEILLSFYVFILAPNFNSFIWLGF